MGKIVNNKSLYSKLHATRYIGRNGIMEITLKEHSSEDLFTITIKGGRLSYQQKIGIKELIFMRTCELEQLMTNIYSKYLTVIEEESENDK